MSAVRDAEEKRQIDELVTRLSAEVVKWLTEGPEPKARGERSE